VANLRGVWGVVCCGQAPLRLNEFSPLFTRHNPKPEAVNDFLRYVVSRAGPELQQYFGSGRQCPPVQLVLTSSFLHPGPEDTLAKPPATPDLFSASFTHHMTSHVRTMFGPLSEARFVDSAVLTVAAQKPVHSAVVVHCGHLAPNDSVALVTRLNLVMRRPLSAITASAVPAGSSAPSNSPSFPSLKVLMHLADVDLDKESARDAKEALAPPSAAHLKALEKRVVAAVQYVRKLHPESATYPVIVSGLRGTLVRPALSSLLSDSTIIDAFEEGLIAGAGYYLTTFAL
jgi:hypothetical protein